MIRSVSKRGAISTLGIVLLVLVGAVVVVYFTSDVWRTRIDAAADQYAHWTPENIAKDPENYLNFCEAEANKALMSLKASEIAMSQNRASLENTLKEAKSKIGLGSKALDELKALYTSTEQAQTWPAKWQGRSLDGEAAKRQIISLHKQVTAEQTLQERVEQALRKIEVQVEKILEARADTQNQLTEIKTGREMLKVQKLTNDLTLRLASIKGSLQATIGTVSETSGPISLDQLAEQSAGVVDDAEFSAIMGQ